MLAHYKKAANLRHAEAHKLLGYCFETRFGTEANLVPAAKYYKAAAEAGNVRALTYYGFNMLYGRGIEENEPAAVHLLKIAMLKVRVRTI